jgi:hypothetical protein
MKVELFPYAGDLDRQKILADLVVKYSVHPKIRELATKLVRGCPNYNTKCELDRIFNFVRDNIRYTEDVAYIDSYHSPLRILELGVADCDDFTILTDSLLASIGWTVGSRIISTSPNRPYHHIYSIVVFPKNCPIRFVNNKAILPKGCMLIPLDPSVKTLKCCQEVKHAKERNFLFVPDFMVVK